MIPTDATPARGSNSTPPGPPRSVQYMENMAVAAVERCPICLDTWEEATYLMPCLHTFCSPCIMRWLEIKPECPVCKGRVMSMLRSVQTDNHSEERNSLPPATPLFVSLAQEAPINLATYSLHHPEALEPPDVVPLPMLQVGDFYPYVWASIFRIYPSVLNPLLPWLHQELEQILEDVRHAASVESIVLVSLRYCGLDENALTPLLQHAVGRHVRRFVHQLVNTIVRECSEGARRLMGFHDARTAGWHRGRSRAAPRPAASRRPASRRALQRSPGILHHAFLPIHWEHEDAQEDPEQAVPRALHYHLGQPSP